MKKFFLTLAATAMCATTFTAVGEVTTILDQTFEEGTTLTDTKTYMWGSEVQGMITANGVSVTNNSNVENNYENRDFLKFPTSSPIGNSTHAVNVSYKVYSPKDFGQAPAYFSVNFFDGKNKFLFGIKEGSGSWAYTAAVVTTDADGNLTEAPLPKGHMSKGGGDIVNLTVKFSGETAIVDIDGGSYSTYCNKEGLTGIKLSVSGDKDWDRGMYIQNFKIETEEVAAVETANYTLKYVCGSETLKEVSKAGSVGEPIVINADETAPLWNEDKTVKYIFVSDDAAGKTIAAGEVVTLTYRVAADWNYTVANNVNSETITGTCIEGESVTAPFSRYALAANGVVWTKAAIDKQYNYTFTPDANNFKAELEYTETEMTNGLLFIEAEKLTGLTEVTSNNANIRCSNAAAGYIEVAEGEEAAPVEICKLGKGTYTVESAVWGGKANSDSNITVVIKAGNETVLEITTTGSWTNKTSEEFTLDAETSLTVEGPIKNQPVDYFLVCGTTDQTPTAVEAIEAVKDGKWYNLQGVQVAQPTVKGLYIHNGKKVIVK